MPQASKAIARMLAPVAAAIALAASAQPAAGAPRIVGGSIASRPYPHHALVTTTFQVGSGICGATLIAARYVVTAAHCVSETDGTVVGPGQVEVGLGSPSRSAITDRYGVAEVVRHPAFGRLGSGAEQVPDFDVAVLRLVRGAPYEPARVPVAGTEAATWAAGTTATVIGWGVTETGSPSDALREASLPVRSDADCAAVYGALFDARAMLCAGTGLADTCEGDSGGPLLVPSGGALVLAGITSWGLGCGNPGIPGVYTRVADEPLNGWLRGTYPHAGFSVTPPDPESGQPVVLTSTSSNPREPYTELSWDVDGDGAFDDATGPTVRTAFDRGVHGVGLQAANAQGDRETARATVEAAARTPVAFARPRFAVTEGRSISIPVRAAPPPGREGTGSATVAVVGGPGRAGTGVAPPAPGSVAFGPGSAVRDVLVRAVEDRRDERPETVRLALGSASGALVLGTPAEAVLTIRDDDRPRRLRIRLGRARLDGTVVLRTRLAVPGRVAIAVRELGSGRLLAAGRARRGRAGRAAVRVRLTRTGRRLLRRGASPRVRVTLRFTSAHTGDRSVSRRDGRLR
jgi:secreted trypsin-like serine protease